MQTLGGKKLGYMLSPEIRKIQSILDNRASFFSTQSPLKDINDLVKINSLSGEQWGYFLPPEIEKIQSLAKKLEHYFSNRNLTISFDDLFEEPISDSDNEPLNEQEKTIISEIIEGKEPSIPLDKIKNENFWKIIEKIVLLYEFLSLIMQSIGGMNIPLQHLYENFTNPRTAIEQLLEICDKYAPNGRSYEARTVKIKEGYLHLRQYDRKSSKSLAKLPDGKLVCVLKPPKDNAQWILVATQLDNGKVLKGYIARKHTSQLK